MSTKIPSTKGDSVKEAKIQAEIVKWLQSEKFWFCSIPNEAAAGNKVRQMQLVAMGLRKGAPDLLLFHRSGAICLEVKTPTGRQSDAQRRFQSRVEDLGYRYFVVRSVEDVKNVLTECEECISV